MPATSTTRLSVQVSDFEDKRLLVQPDCLICDFCSSSQRFACGFLQIPSRDGHPCRPANDSPCRVRRRLSLPSKSALPGARHKKSGRFKNLPLFIPDQLSLIPNEIFGYPVIEGVQVFSSALLSPTRIEEVVKDSSQPCFTFFIHLFRDAVNRISTFELAITGRLNF